MSVLVKEVALTLDRKRHLRLDFNAARHYKRVTGRSLFDKEIWENLDAEEIVSMTWALLVHEDKSLTLDDVGAMIHPGNSAEVFSKLLETYAGDSQAPAEGQEPAHPPTQAPQS